MSKSEKQRNMLEALKLHLDSQNQKEKTEKKNRNEYGVNLAFKIYNEHLLMRLYGQICLNPSRINIANDYYSEFKTSFANEWNIRLRVFKKMNLQNMFEIPQDIVSKLGGYLQNKIFAKVENSSMTDQSNNVRRRISFTQNVLNERESNNQERSL